MDLESECSVLEDKEVFPERNSHVDHLHDKIKSNGSCGNEIDELNYSENNDVNLFLADTKGKGIEIMEPVNSPPMKEKSPAEELPLSKGYGLKKWRRIRRDSVKDSSGSIDGSKILKRGFLFSGSPRNKQTSEGSVGSVNMSKHPGVVESSKIFGSSSNSRMAAGSAFAAGTDSENSEDRSSKSSTAASVPTARYNLPAALGHVREKNRMKNFSGKNLGSSVQQVQQGKNQIESSKKHRAERVKIEKDNSHSSMESDSRSSNFIFLHGSFSGTSNGKQSRTIDDGENSDDAHVSEQYTEEVQAGCGKEFDEEVGDVSPDDLAAGSSWDAKEEKSENHPSLVDPDPLENSILALQSAQEALEKEVRKLEDVGKETLSLRNNSSKDGNEPTDFSFTDTNNREPSLSDPLGSEIRQTASSALEAQVLNLTQNTRLLERKLEEATAMLNVKESRISELQSALSINKSWKEGCREMETEIEGFFKQKIEAEVEYLTLVTTIQKLRVSVDDQIALFEEQKTLAEERAQMLNKIGETESKAAILKQQAEELEQSCGDILLTKEVSEIQSRVCKFTTCFLIQLILLVFVFWVFLLQFSPHSGVVPT